MTEVVRATYVTIPTWSENALVETSGEIGENFLDLSCESAILISQDTGEVLYEHNAHEKLRPASVTKVMTILLIMEEIDSGRLSYSDKIACSENASSMGGSQIWLDATEELTVDEMLKAICVVSANDCTVAMAEHIAGSEEMFVEKMNQRAKELGMNDTTFKNCHGIDEDGHETSSYDIALMSKHSSDSVAEEIAGDLLMADDELLAMEYYCESSKNGNLSAKGKYQRLLNKYPNGINKDDTIVKKKINAVRNLKTTMDSKFGVNNVSSQRCKRMIALLSNNLSIEELDDDEKAVIEAYRTLPQGN